MWRKGTEPEVRLDNTKNRFENDKGNSVVLIKSSILGQSDGPSELVSLACMFMTQQQQDKVDGSTSKLMVAP